MSPERWQAIKEITADILELPLEQRAHAIAQATGRDEELRDEVSRLVGRHAELNDQFLRPLSLWNARRLLEQAAADERTFQDGEMVASRFRIARFVERGGMGEVYEAWDAVLNKVVALKTIRPDIAGFPGMVERFEQEVAAAHQISHRNVCRVHDVCTTETPEHGRIVFLSMEYLPGETLAARIRKGGRLTPKQALPLIEQLTSGLAAAHAAGIVHRDFKTANILLIPEAEGGLRAVITDFGLAGGLADHRADKREGTPAYMAPEQVQGQPAGFAADQYSLGVVIFEMLTGRCPFQGVTPEETAELRLHEPPPRPRSYEPGISRRWQCVILRALRIDPDHRYPSVTALMQALRKPVRSLQLRSALVAASIVCAVAVTAGYTLRGGADGITGLRQLTSNTDLSAYPSLSRDGKTVVYLSDRGEPGNSDIWIQQLPDGQPRRLTSDPAEENQPAISADGHKVAFRSSRGGGGVYLIDTEGGPERLVAPGGWGPRFSPDGQFLAYWTGELNTATPTGKVWVVPVNGGPAQQIAADFADARVPVWHSERNVLLFRGCRELHASLNACSDWWVKPENASQPTRTGILSTPQFALLAYPEPTAWVGNEVLFSARLGTRTDLWYAGVRPDGSTIGRPRQLTHAEQRALTPTVLSDGTIAFARLAGATHIWRVSLNASEPIRKVTDSAQSDGCPNVSADGRLLAFTRRGTQAMEIWVRDLRANTERLVVQSRVHNLYPLLSEDGATVVWQALEDKGTAIYAMPLNGGNPRQLCTNCENPSGWLSESELLMRSSSLERVEALAMKTGERKVILSRLGWSLDNAAAFPPTRRLAFSASRGGAQKQIFVSDMQGAGAADWVPVTDASTWSDHPVWSRKGETLTYFSFQDGGKCVWSRNFDQRTGQPVGPARAVMHFHNARFSPERTASTYLKLTVSGQAVFTNIGEASATIWIGQLQFPAWLRDLLLRWA